MSGHRPFGFLLLLFLAVFSLAGCSALLTGTVIRPAVNNLQQQTDIFLVCDGAPAYLLMLDSMLVSSPASEALLLTATQSYSAYAAALEECGGEPTRIATIAGRAKDYGQRLLHRYLPAGTMRDLTLLSVGLAELRQDQLPPVFWATYGWLSWVKTEQGSPAAMADLAVIERIMARLLELDESYHGGAIHLFFGVVHASRPAMLGGRPELARDHFERAIALSGGKFLQVQTAYAETLARATLDADLHDRLLAEVLAFPVDSAPEQALSNRLAMARAARLLAENYFAD